MRPTTTRAGAERFTEGARAIVIAVARATIAGSSRPIEPVDPRSPAGGFAWKDRATVIPSRSVRNSATVFCCCGGEIVRSGSIVDGEVLAAREICVDVVFPPLCAGTTEFRNPSKAVTEGSAEKSESDQLTELRSSLLSVRRGGLTGVRGMGDIGLVMLRVSPSSSSGSTSVLIACWIANAGCARVAGGESGSGLTAKRGGGRWGPGRVSRPVRVGELTGDVGDPCLLTWATPDRTDPSRGSVWSRTEGRRGGKNCG